MFPHETDPRNESEWEKKSFKKGVLGIPWWSSGYDLALSLLGAWGSIPGQGTKILQAMRQGPPPKKEKIKF